MLNHLLYCCKAVFSSKNEELNEIFLSSYKFLNTVNDCLIQNKNSNARLFFFKQTSLNQKKDFNFDFEHTELYVHKQMNIFFCTKTILNFGISPDYNYIDFSLHENYDNTYDLFVLLYTKCYISVKAYLYDLLGDLDIFFDFETYAIYDSLQFFNLFSSHKSIEKIFYDKIKDVSFLTISHEKLKQSFDKNAPKKYYYEINFFDAQDFIKKDNITVFDISEQVYIYKILQNCVSLLFSIIIEGCNKNKIDPIFISRNYNFYIQEK
ncbi:hypothetical protein GVAV_001573 [Gurleya vavrai]